MANANTEKIDNLNAGWYKYVSKNVFGVDESTFRLAQGTLGLQTKDSSGLFMMSDAIPPDSALGYYDPGTMQSRSSNYRSLLVSLRPERTSGLDAILGDNYSNWIAYRNAYFKDNPTTTQAEIFAKFANQRLDPGLAREAIAAYKQAEQAPLNIAFDALAAEANRQTFTTASGQQQTLYKYSATLDAAQTAINRGSEKTIDYDSHTTDTKLTHTFARGSTGGFYNIFSGGASVSFDQLNTKAASSRITIKGMIEKAATLVTGPVGWFTSGEYNRAYNGKNDNRIWNPDADQDWDGFFGQPDGALARSVSQLFLVDGYEIIVTSHASYSQEDRQKIETHASFGIWPFFSVGGSTNHRSEHVLNEDSSLSVTHKLNRGSIQIWGVSVLEASKLK